MSASEEYTFVCPDCGESMAVNPAMRDALLENGCVVCGSAVSPAAFSTADTSAGQ
jgi:rRNA maturation protein Nop10